MNFSFDQTRPLTLRDVEHLLFEIPEKFERRFRALVAKHDLKSHFDDLRGGLRPGFEIYRGKPSKNKGSSRFGGIPDVPEGFKWPKGRLGLLSFIAQIKLNELPRFVDPLPRRGYLLFFADLEGFQSAVLSFVSVPKTLQPATVPNMQDFTPGAADTPIFTASPIKFEPAVFIKPIDPLRCEDDDFWDRYYELKSDLEDSDSRLLGYSYYDPSEHGLAGGFEKWDPLLQVDSFYPCPEMLWNDNGKLAFFVRRGCVKRAAFGRPVSVILGAG